MLSEILKLLNDLKQNDCWCEMSIGNPMVQEHTEVCLEAQNVVERIEQQLAQDRFLPVRTK